MLVKNSFQKIKLTSIVLMILMIVAIFNLPYGYYIFLRVASLVCTSFIILNLYNISKFEDFNILIVTIILILFNPIFPFEMEKSNWRVFNLIAALYFGYLAFYHCREK